MQSPFFIATTLVLTLMSVPALPGDGFSGVAIPKSPSENIRINQIGFYPSGPKVAIVVGSKATKFSIVSVANKKDTVYSGELKKAGVW